MAETEKQYIPLSALEQSTERFHTVVPGYVVPNASSVNSEAAAGLIEYWIQASPPGSITLRSQEWILSQWKLGRGVMVVTGEEGKEQEPLFGNGKLSIEKLRERIVSVAFLNQLDGIALEDEVELGTVVSNPDYRSNGIRRGMDGGAKAFQAVQDRAHQLFPNARLFTWVKNGSVIALQRAFSPDQLQQYIIEDTGKAEAVFAGCAGCLDQKAKTMCCHQGFEVSNQDLGLTYNQTDQI